MMINSVLKDDKCNRSDSNYSDDKSCLIITGGEYTDLDELAIFEQFNIKDKVFDYVIACDHGMDYAIKYGITPNLLVGDYDSIDNINEDLIKEKGVEIMHFPPEKDDTDTMLAVRRAVEMKTKELVIVCAFGGRLDHAFANIQAAAYAANYGLKVTLIGNNTLAVVAGENRGILIDKMEGWSLSVFSMTDRCTDVIIKGCKYNTDGVELTNSFPIGISNEFVDDIASITHKEGNILVMMSKMPLI